MINKDEPIHFAYAIDFLGARLQIDNRTRTNARGLINVIDRMIQRRESPGFFNVTESQDVGTIIDHADFLKELLEPLAKGHDLGVIASGGQNG
jgi:hypothetical protein